MKRSNLSAGIYLLLVFLSGALVGAFAHRLYMVNSVISSTARKSPEEYRRKYVEEYRRKYVEEMKSRLALNRDQVAKLQAVLDETRSCYDQLHEQSKPAMKAIHD